MKKMYAYFSVDVYKQFEVKYQSIDIPVIKKDYF